MFQSLLLLTLTNLFSPGWAPSDSQPSTTGSNPIPLQHYVNDTSHLVAPGAQLVKISDQFSFTEGPAADKKGNIYFTDQPNDNIWKFDTKGRLNLFMTGAKRSNGLYFDRRWNLLACADANNEIIKIDGKKNIEVLVGKVNGHRLNGPNDLWVDADGGIYFTDPLYKRPYWTHEGPDMPGEHVYYFNPVTKNVTRVDSSLRKPNGIIGTPDGKYLYIADIGDNKTYRFTITGKGTIGEKKLFASAGSDGLTIDHLGNVYLTGSGIGVYNPAGEKISQINVPEGWTANLCFGGKKRDMLFITASKAVYTLKMNVHGTR
ncbi:MAG: SMP-30/gluconolactonase/LRE family protein [Chitinophagaceae bacterium]|nr:MAG: SMP-30/gluconolactonase/LRE family protein [Chitinophagaceae bacterium]